MSHSEPVYSSDTNDEQWSVVHPLLPLKQEGPGRPIELNMRQVVNGIFYVVRTGCQWENLPSDYPNYNSVYYHYRKWCEGRNLAAHQHGAATPGTPAGRTSA